MNRIFYDFETNSTNPNTTIPIQLGYLGADGSNKTKYIHPTALRGVLPEVTDEYLDGFELNNNYGHVDDLNAAKVHQIPLSRLKADDAIKTPEELKSYLRNTFGTAGQVNVGYNNDAYDSKILNRLLNGVGLTNETKEFDLMKDIEDLVGGPEKMTYLFGGKRQEDIARGFGIKLDATKLHDADYDIKVAKEIYEKLPAAKKQHATIAALEYFGDYEKLEKKLNKGQVMPFLTNEKILGSYSTQSKAHKRQVLQYRNNFLKANKATRGDRLLPGNLEAELNDTRAKQAFKEIKTMLMDKKTVKKGTMLKAGVAAAVVGGVSLAINQRSKRKEQEEKINAIEQKLYNGKKVTRRF